MVGYVGDGSTNPTKWFEPTGSEPEPDPDPNRAAPWPRAEPSASRGDMATQARAHRRRLGWVPAPKIDPPKIAALEGGASSSLT